MSVCPSVTGKNTPDSISACSFSSDTLTLVPVHGHAGCAPLLKYVAHSLKYM